MVDKSNYVLAETETDAESVRLALLENWLDPGTLRRLDALNIAPGSRCLEVGAGRGSIAQWLSAKVGPDGKVVAADIDCRFLAGLPDNVEVRALDIRYDDLEPDTYDLVHCRALVSHLPDPGAALRRMVAALRPGGILLAEEGDNGLFSFGGHADAQWATEQWRRQWNGLISARGMDPHFGRKLPGLLAEIGLELMGADIDASVARYGDPAFEFQRLTWAAVAPALMAVGLASSEDEHARVMRVMQSPSTTLIPIVVVAAWARRMS